MGWLASLYLGVKFATSGGPSKTNVAATPPINASSSDEADFIKCANSTATTGHQSANRDTGSSWTSRIRRTKRSCRKQRLYGLADAVYVYQSWRHELSINSDSRIQIPSETGFAIRGINHSNTCLSVPVTSSNL